MKTLQQLLETTKVDWVFCSDSLAEKPNFLQLLRYVSSQGSLDLRLSLLVSEENLDLLHAAYGLGLLSHHLGLDAKDAVEESFAKLFAVIERYQGKDDLIANTYCLAVLRQKKDFSSVVDLQKKLLGLNPGCFDLLIFSAEAHFRGGDKELAETLWMQAKTLDPSQLATIKASQVEAGFLTSDGTDDAIGSKLDVNILGIKRAVVVDPSEEDLAMIEARLLELGVPEVKVFSKVDSFFEFLKSRLKLDLVICEWSFPQMPGPILVQSIREKIGDSVPITVINKSLSEKDLPILREMGVTDRISKPIEKSRFNQEVVWIINQERNPSEPIMIRQKLNRCIKAKDKDQIAILLKKYQACPDLRKGDAICAEAAVAYSNGLYLTAKELSVQSLRECGDSQDALNTLGKAMMKLREFDSALICLENAKVISPNNIERICRIAEANMELGNDQLADDSISEAKALAPNSSHVVGIQAKKALTNHDVAASKNFLSQLDSLEEIVSFINNRAVALIRTKSFQSGLQLYQDAFTSVPEDRQQIKTVLAYNFALGQIRTSEQTKALELLKTIKIDKSSVIGKKIGSLRSRLSAALSSGAAFQLRPAAPPSLEAEKSRLEAIEKQSLELLKAIKIRPGDLCLLHVLAAADQLKSFAKHLEPSLQLNVRLPGSANKSAS